jgi:hexokinase
LKHVECPTIGFCFNFPVEATSINSGTLLKWVKGFANPGAVGQDPAKLLADAFKRKV